MEKRKIFMFLFLGVMSLLLLCGIHFICKSDQKITVIPPTCLENGYTVYEKDGETQIKDIVPATGHQFADWVIMREAETVTCGIKERICRVCGAKETQSFHQSSELARISFEGNIVGISKTQQVKVRTEFFSDDLQFNGYALLKYQGHDSLKYDKKNFTVKFYEDEDCKKKNEFTFADWSPENKFILKANFCDISRSRNLICADIWDGMVSTRMGVNSRLLQTSNNGAVDGFPVSVYLNNEFIGLFNLTLHKDDDLFAMEEGRKDGIVIANKGDTPEALFRKTIDWNDSNDWEIEYCGTEDDKWIKEQMNRFIEFVINSSDENFKNKLSEYADVNSLVDYMIAMYSLGLQTGVSRDLLFVSYDGGVWIASLFDMENAFGLLENELTFSEPYQNLPVQREGVWYSGTESLLWDRFINAFYAEIAERYISLRKDVLSEDSIDKIVNLRTGAIPQNFNLADFELYPEQPMQGISHSEQIKGYASERLALLDEIFDNND